jgi:hypothetical protein
LGAVFRKSLPFKGLGGIFAVNSMLKPAYIVALQAYIAVLRPYIEAL